MNDNRQRPVAGLGARFGFWTVRYRWGIVCVTLAFVAAAGLGTRFLAFSTDYRDFFEKDNPYLLAFENLSRSYTWNDNAIFVLAPKDGRVFTRETLAAVDELTRSAWLTPYSTRVDSLTNFPHTSARGDDLVVKFLAKDPLNLSGEQLERAKAAALSDPQIVHCLVSPSGHVAAVFVNIFLPHKAETELGDATSYLRKLAEDARARHPDIGVYLGGSVMLSDVLVEASRDDLRKVFPAMYGAVFLVLSAALRSFGAIASALSVVALAIAVAFGMAGWMGVPVSAISVNAPTLILTVAVANNIHLLTTFLFRMREEGTGKNEAIAGSLDINALPILVNNTAAAIGFSSLCFSAAPPFRDMGVIVVLGLSAAFLLSVFFLPALLAILPVSVKPRAGVRQAFVERLGVFIVKRRQALFWGMLALVAALAVQIPRLEMNERFTEYFDERFAFRRDADFIAENFSGFGAIEYSPESGEKRGVVKPEYLAVVDRFAGWLKQQPEVVFVDALSDIFKRINRTLHGDDDAYYRVPGNGKLSAQYLALYEMSLPVGFDLDTQIKYDESASRLSVVLKNPTDAELLDLERRAQGWIEKNAPPGMFARGTGPMVLFAHVARDSAGRMLSGGVLTLVLISALLVAPLRSFKYGLISLAPNLVPSIMAYGLWGLMGRPLGLAGSVVATMSLGIVVNDNVHFLCEYVRARREMGLAPEDAALFAIRVAGVPMWSASIILVAGFAMLSFSGFTVNSTMGLMTAVTIAFALAADFFFLPPLLLKVEEWTRKQGAR